MVAISTNGVPVRLTRESWRHIREGHPEINEPEEVLQAVRSPDVVQRGEFGARLAVRRLDGNHLIVVYREVTNDDGFVITAYLAQRLKRGPILWSR